MINRRFTNLEGEVWVPLLREYEISNMGRVVSLKGTFPRIMRTYRNNHGYHLVHLRINNKRIAYTVHRLVALIFVNNLEVSRNTVNHHFGKDDNKASSLSWMTQAENNIHGMQYGLYPIGSDHHNSILDELQVKTIRSLRNDLTEVKLAGYFKVSRGTVNNIHRRKSWVHVN